MEDLIGVLAFIVIAIFSLVSRYREAQRSKNEQLPPQPPKPRTTPGRPDPARRQLERRDIRTARPAGAPRPTQPVTGQRPPAPRPVAAKPQVRQAPRPAAGPITAQRVPAPPQRPAAVKPTPLVIEQETPRMRPEQVRHAQKPAALAQIQATAGRDAARRALQQAVEQETDTGFASAANARESRAAGLPPLFRNMAGIRAGIIFSEIINKPVAFR